MRSPNGLVNAKKNNSCLDAGAFMVDEENGGIKRFC